MIYDLLNFKVHGDNTGNLVALEKMSICHSKLREFIIFGEPLKKWFEANMHIVS